MQLLGVLTNVLKSVATKRMLSKSISQSLQVDSLSLQAQLLFTWMIPHADDEGRMNGTPRWVKGTVVPLKSNRNWSERSIELYLLEMAGVKLIYYWYQGGNRYLQFPTWREYQTIQTDRAQLSRIPAYNGDVAKDAKDFPDLSPSPELDAQTIQDLIGVDTQYKLSRDNIKEFKEKEKKIVSILGTLKKPIDVPPDPRIKHLETYFVYKCKELKGFTPEILWGRDGFMLQRRLVKYSEEQIKELIDAFLTSDISEKLGCSLSTILATSVINQWLGGQFKRRGGIAKMK